MQEKSIHTSANRSYRSSLNLDKNEQQLTLSIEESDLYITLSKNIKKEIILPYIHKELYALRAQIKAYTLVNPLFQSSLLPLEQDLKAPLLIQEMLNAGKIAQIGPFSAVAGTVAEYIARKIHTYIKENLSTEENYSSDVLVENGGDIYIISKNERIVAILDKPINGIKLGLKVKASYNEENIKSTENKNEIAGFSLCSSSSTIGHSLSFGNADLVLIIARKGSIADSLATAACNMLKSEKDFPFLLDFIKKQEKHNVLGIFASCNNEIMAYGDIELCQI